MIAELVLDQMCRAGRLVRDETGRYLRRRIDY